MAAKRQNIDMTTGPLTGKIIRFAFPLVVGNLLQLTFDAADMAIIGNFSSSESMAAIGVTGAINGLLLTFVGGIAGGANVVTAQSVGARDQRGISHAIHTSLALGVIFGIVLMLTGLCLAEPLLRMINVPEKLMSNASLYLRLRFLGVPFGMVGSFSASVMRGSGDSRRPVYYMLAAGLLNVILNIIAVVGLKMDVAGVAIATVLSQILSATLLVRALICNSGPTKLIVTRIRLYRAALKKILWIGVPGGAQASFYSISNLVIMSAIASLGAYAIAGNVSAGTIESLIHAISFALYQTSLAAVGQNFGAKKYDRVRGAFLRCVGCSMTSNLVLGWSAWIFGEALLAIINPDPEVIRTGMVRMGINMTTYFVSGLLDIVTSTLRGMGISLFPAIVTMCGICVLRVIWVNTIFKHYQTLASVYISYPISWTIVAVINGVLLFVVLQRLVRGKKSRYGTVKAA